MIPQNNTSTENDSLDSSSTSSDIQLTNENVNGHNYLKSMPIGLTGLIASFINFKDTEIFSLTSKSIFKLYLPIVRHLPLKNVVIDQGHSGF
ncbi:MAG: hypothetical protein HON55_00835 [Legionellales bacterium]|jgi:hypothetical protein|nr:hypothetical protein [Legionellales bacterium]